MVAVVVVDRLEPVEVDHHEEQTWGNVDDGRRSLCAELFRHGAVDGGDLRFDELVQVAPVSEPGE